MAEYIFENLIMNPFKEGLEGLIGKEVYYSDKPFSCLKRANVDFGAGILKYIRKDDPSPFYVETPSGNIFSYPCITPKKEEPKPEPKYVPFKSMEEFVERYTEVRKEAESGSFNDNLFQCGMWLKEKKRPDVYCMVTEIWNCGVDVSGNRTSTEENSVIKDFTTWENLYLGYTFLDGSPCGNKVETING